MQVLNIKINYNVNSAAQKIDATKLQNPQKEYDQARAMAPRESEYSKSSEAQIEQPGGYAQTAQQASELSDNEKREVRGQLFVLFFDMAHRNDLKGMTISGSSGAALRDVAQLAQKKLRENPMNPAAKYAVEIMAHQLALSAKNKVTGHVANFVAPWVKKLTDAEKAMERAKAEANVKTKQSALVAAIAKHNVAVPQDNMIMMKMMEMQKQMAA